MYVFNFSLLAHCHCQCNENMNATILHMPEPVPVYTIVIKFFCIHRIVWCNNTYLKRLILICMSRM